MKHLYQGFILAMVVMLILAAVIGVVAYRVIHYI